MASSPRWAERLGALGAVSVTGALLVGPACGPTKAEQELVGRGRVVYMTNCTACHNPNPKLDGNVGPAVHGSTLELLRLRVVEGRYPDGYAPKRPTKLMVPLPHLAKDVEALSAFLNGQ